MEEAITRTTALLQETGYKPAWEKLLVRHPDPAPHRTPGWLSRALSTSGVVLVGAPPGCCRSVGLHLRT
eukprot:1530364-Alexandrium_andersonii.AAC.1